MLLTSTPKYVLLLAGASRTWGCLAFYRRTSVRVVIFGSCDIDKDRELRILFLGLDNAGKTTTLKHLLGEPLDTISPTFGFSIRTLVRHSYVL